MFLLICKLHICIQNVFGHIFYSTRLHLYQQVWQFEVQKLAYMLILAAGGMIPYLSSVGGYPPFPLRKKTFFLGPKTLFFAFFYAFLALFGPLYGLFGPFLTLFNEKNIIFSPFRKKFPGKA